MSRFRAQSWTADSDGHVTSRRRNTLPSLEQSLMELDQAQARTGPKAVFFTQWKTFSLLLVSWILFVFYLQRSTSGDDAVTSLQVQHKTLSPAHLHLIVPASKPDPNLCKVLVSAAINGYPSPAIINWKKEFTDGGLVDGGSHLAKITGVSDYLDKLDSYQDDDLVLMVDGYDIWMQLPPQTLIDRYFDINRRADQRIAKALGYAAHSHDIHQDIIFSCQKKCWPWTENDPPCYAVPQSSLPDDIYGPDTDQDIGDEANPYAKYRQRYINSGVAIGTVRAMRKLFAQAKEYLKTERNMGSDQHIFSHILGDQEVWREAVRRDSFWSSMNLREKLWDGRKNKIKFNDSDIAQVRAKAAAREDKSFEFSLGLDYEGLIGLATVFAEDDTAWLTWNSTSSLRAAEASLSIPPEKSRMQTLSSDISNTVPPFWTFSNEPILPRWTPWSHVPLFTNIYTGNIPAIIHHNAHRDGRKALRETWWNETWYFPHLRTLYDTSVYEPILPIATSGYDAQSLREYWPFERWKAGGRDGSGPWDPHHPGWSLSEKWISYADACREWHEEVFRDGKGEWILPNVH